MTTTVKGAQTLGTDFYQGLASGIDQILNGDIRPRKIGFAVFVFEFDKFQGGQVNNVSNADRSTMIAAVKEWLARHEGRVIDAETKQ